MPAYAAAPTTTRPAAIAVTAFSLSFLLIAPGAYPRYEVSAGGLAPAGRPRPVCFVVPHAENPSTQSQRERGRRAPRAAAARRAAACVRVVLAAAVPDRGAARSAPFRGRPALVVAADDRMARDLALDLRAYLAPAPGALLSGARRPLRVAPGAAARTWSACGSRRSTRCSSRAAGDPPVVVASAVALMERIPDPELRPHGFALAVGEELDLDETLERLVACGYSARSRSSSAASSPCAAASSTSTRRPRSAPCASSCSATRSSRCAGSRPSRSARSRTRSASRSRRPPSSTPEYRELAEMAAREEWRAARTSRRCCRWTSFRSFLELVPEQTPSVVVAAEEELRPALADHWQDVTTSLHSDDAHDLYLPPERGRRGARAARRR